MQRKKLPPGAVAKNAPDEAVSTYARVQAQQAEAELEERLKRCDPIFAELEEKTINPRSLPHPEIPHVNFEARRARVILSSFLTAPTLDKSMAVRLARRAKYLRLQGQGDPGEQPLSEVYRHLPRRFSGKCPTRSELVTALASYFWQCRNIRTFLNVPARYEFIGRIIEGISTPGCLLCGRRHRFQSWRAVRAVDDEKAERHPSREGEGRLLDEAKARFEKEKAAWERRHNQQWPPPKRSKQNG